MLQWLGVSKQALNYVSFFGQNWTIIKCLKWVGNSENANTLDRKFVVYTFSFRIFQLDYYSLDAPSHWSTVSNVNEEIYTVDNLASSSTIVFVVRAQNHHGLSPPSPMSKVSETNELQIVDYFFQVLQKSPKICTLWSLL